jgi:hypothetical protein
MELPDREVCYRALQSRDPRFDGLLFVGVTSTGIYCRPVCPARTARYENVRFFASAALRAFREMDAFPASDIGLLRGAAIIDGTPRSTPTHLLNRAESWRPWRAYAAQHLWAADHTSSSIRRSPHV